MKETGIIMSGSHPRDILEGRKSMTRRTWGLEMVNKNPDDWQLVASFLDGKARFYNPKTEGDISVQCPYGGVGDRLWVRETFNIIETIVSPYPVPDKIIYKASPETYQDYNGIHWRPSIYMPRRASRILLEITEVGVGRLQDISEKDIRQEGILEPLYVKWNPFPLSDEPDHEYTSWVSAFHKMWDSLNAKRGYPWGGNYWVWPISFRLLLSE